VSRRVSACGSQREPHVRPDGTQVSERVACLVRHGPDAMVIDSTRGPTRKYCAQREALPLGFVRRVGGSVCAIHKIRSGVHCRRTRDARNRYSWCLGGRRAARARETGEDERPKPRGVAAPVDVVLDRTRHWSAPATPRGVRDASVRPGPRSTPRHYTSGGEGVDAVRLTDNILYSKCLLVISFKTLHQRFHHALER